MTNVSRAPRQSFTPAAKVPDALKAGKFDKRHELWDAKLTNARPGSPGVGRIYGESAKFAFYVAGAEHPRLGQAKLVIAPMVCGEAQWTRSSTRALTAADIGALTTVIAESGAEFSDAVAGFQKKFELEASVGDLAGAKATLRGLDYLVDGAVDHKRADKFLVRLNDPSSYKPGSSFDLPMHALIGSALSAAMVVGAGAILSSMYHPLPFGVGLGVTGLTGYLLAAPGLAKTSSTT